MKIDIDLKKEVDQSYPIYFDRLARSERITLEGKVAIITNAKVGGLHLKTLLQKIDADELYIITLPDGERFKNQRSIDLIHEHLFTHTFGRKDLLIALGGGVIGDMTGYAAAIYQRGIDFIQIPTTLLAQVDASVGGKTGINNAYGKNLIGAFHQPRAVYIERAFLRTLPAREFSAGVAEMAKMAIMFDAPFFAWLEEADLGDEEALGYALRKSVQTKAEVVRQDERERGVRAVLNYGHTFAHVIENFTGYSRYLHGEAVAIGMHMANLLALRLGLLDAQEVERIRTFLVRHKLPVTFCVEDPERFYAAFFHDKKAAREKVTFILPSHIGNYAIRDDIPKELLIEVLDAFGDC